MVKKETTVGYYTLQVLFNMACSDDVIISTKAADGDELFQVNSYMFILLCVILSCASYFRLTWTIIQSSYMIMNCYKHFYSIGSCGTKQKILKVICSSNITHNYLAIVVDN